MSNVAATTPETASGQAAAVVAGYIFGAIGVLLALLITCVVVRRVRWRSARKYIKSQSARSVPSHPPPQGSSSSVRPPTPRGSRPSSAARDQVDARPKSRYTETRERRLELRRKARQQKEAAKQRRKEAKLGVLRAPPQQQRSEALKERRTPRPDGTRSARVGGSGGRENSVYFVTGPSMSNADYAELELELPGNAGTDLDDSWTSGHTVQVEVHVRNTQAAKDSIVELDAGIDDEEV